MDYSPELLKQFADTCGIPTVQPTQKVWIVRTRGGRYYKDFCRNEYVALGWDKIPLRWITDESRNKQEVIDDIRDEYPDEKRPGLIYGQLVDFIRVMSPGDYVVIPSEGSNFVSIGTIGELYSDQPKEQPLFEDDYQRCGYHLRRRVTWHKEASVAEDIYLSKMLRAQQTISDITKHADLVYRNLHDLYYVDGTLSLTLRKTNDTPTSLSDEVQLLCAIDETIKSVSTFMGVNETLCIEKKSAISSPGFLQFIMNGISSATPFIVFCLIFKTVGGKIKSADGKEIAKGLPALMQSISNLLNDRADRNLKRAQAEKTDAETLKLKAETRKIDAEAQALALQNTATILAMGEQLDSGAQDAIAMLSEKNTYCAKIAQEVDERQKKIAVVMENMGLQPPKVELPNNIIPFPVDPKE